MKSGKVENLSGIIHKQFSKLLMMILILHTSSLACSGDGAGATIMHSQLRGYQLLGISIFLISFIMSSLWIQPKRKIKIVCSLCLLLIHPGIWLDSYSGDCGLVRVIASYAYSGLLLMLAMIAAVDVYRYKKSAVFPKDTESIVSFFVAVIILTCLSWVIVGGKTLAKCSRIGMLYDYKSNSCEDGLGHYFR